MVIEADGEAYPQATRPLRRLNLNMLYGLDAILRARTLTEAGRMVSLSQPAMSMTLRKLRDHFGDELVIYSGGERRLTALGDALRPRIGHVLRVADDTLNLSLDFDPATAQCSIAIAAPEVVEITFLSRVAAHILRQGPGLDVQLVPFDYSSIERLFERGADVVIVPEAMADPGRCVMPLFDDGLTGMIWAEHPHVGDTLSPDDYLGARHAALYETIERTSSFGDEVDSLLARRKVVVRTGLYSMLPNLVIGTKLIVTTSMWLAQYFMSTQPVRLIKIPISKPRLRLVLQWEKHRAEEPMIRWLVDMIGNNAPNRPNQRIRYSKD